LRQLQIDALISTLQVISKGREINPEQAIIADAVLGDGTFIKQIDSVSALMSVVVALCYTQPDLLEEIIVQLRHLEQRVANNA
jgi:hypothetical protein